MREVHERVGRGGTHVTAQCELARRSLRASLVPCAAAARLAHALASSVTPVRTPRP